MLRPTQIPVGQHRLDTFNCCRNQKEANRSLRVGGQWRGLASQVLVSDGESYMSVREWAVHHFEYYCDRETSAMLSSLFGPE